MASKAYRVASPEGAAWANEEEGSEVELDLSESDERALVCAGWLEPSKPAKKGQ